MIIMKQRPARAAFVAVAAMMTVAHAPATAREAQTARTQQWRILPETGMGAMIDCLEREGRTLISAHRGGPSPGLPENAIPTMDAVLTAVPAVMEIDIARSRDGVHFLLHDRTLDRTTTGSGLATAQDWAAIRQLSLKDEAGWVTPYRVPTLEETLAWAKPRTGLQIDFKAGADHAEVIRLIRAAKMESQVILISYSLDAALKLHALAPEMLISLTIETLDDLAAAQAAGLSADRMIAFAGTQIVRPDLYAALDDGGVEVIFGTLGRGPNALDVMIERLGMNARYVDLGRAGVDMLATDRPREAASALAEAERLPQPGQCGISKDD
jgi:glycerophosphoryl diester phosphodiesterase